MERRILAALALALVLAAGRADAQGLGANDWYTVPIAASRNEMDQVEAIVLDGGGTVDLDAIESINGRTALDYAASFDNAELAKFLLDHGAHVDARDRFGNTALHWAAQRDTIAVLRVLIEGKATVDAQNRQGLTPLMMAADQGNPRSVRLLLQSGADPKKQDFTGRDAIQWGAGKPQVLQALNDRR